MSVQAFDFEKPIMELEERLGDLRRRAEEGDERAKERLARAEAELDRTRRDVYNKLTPWERVLFARHKDRPRAFDYIKALTTEFVELHGDRGFADDKAVICGTARFQGSPVVVIGQQKGKDTKENVTRNFGMMHPEGYRKALRMMRLAEKFGMPILVFIDTPGAFPGVGAEERGQAEAIARNMQEMFGLRVPIIALVIGEGASGGALGVGLADRVLMLENAWYCVISPEGCAAILWKEGSMAPRAAEALKLTASDLLSLGVIDAIVPEPLGGAHRHPGETFANVEKALVEHLKGIQDLSEAELLQKRFDKYRQMGTFREI
ncbi:MAG: acetyl-CoA carboxylase carboxyl transferase subunit alpha [Candidatus Sumerlaeota bacterium]|nr:acetyl-CoA carboxylase carboxyl transferase subunit alpha [Candidatus Sumerlaeota bacterium]